MTCVLASENTVKNEPEIHQLREPMILCIYSKLAMLAIIQKIEGTWQTKLK
jgi:hypothetical protein